MDKKRKVILILIVALILIILFILIYLININNNAKNNINYNTLIADTETQDNIGNSQLDNNEDVNTIWNNISAQKINNANEYFRIKNCLNKFFVAINRKESSNIYNLLDQEYIIANNINLNNVNKAMENILTEKNIITETYKLQKSEKSQYGIELYNCNQATQEVTKIYIKINVDEINKTFSIIPDINNISESQFTLSADNIDIAKNNYNNFEYIDATDASLCREMYNFYNTLMIYLPEEAYKYLNEDYKSLKFNNSYENFVEYINRNKEKIESSVLTRYSIKNREYILTNNYEQTYVLKENQFMDFNICLDSYTIKPNNFNDYSNADKASYFANQVINMINYKEYESLYKLLNNTFKSSNFDTINKFKNYISKNFYDNNYIQNLDIEESGEYYVVKIEIMDNISSAANKKSVSFIIKVLDSNNFEMSLNVS